ncbi:7156_t:CDS:2, partial [Dentiscutata erythropus]
ITNKSENIQLDFNNKFEFNELELLLSNNESEPKVLSSDIELNSELEEILKTNNEPELLSDAESNSELEEILENDNDFIEYFSDNSKTETEALNNLVKKALKLLELKAQKGTLTN